MKKTEKITGKNHIFEELRMTLNTGIETEVITKTIEQYFGNVVRLSEGVVTLLVHENGYGYKRVTLKISAIDHVVFKVPMPAELETFENKYKELIFDCFLQNYDYLDLFHFGNSIIKSFIKDFAIENNYPEPVLYSDTLAEIKELAENFDNFRLSLYEFCFDKFFKQIHEEFLKLEKF
jgi:hypothetical protein